MSDHQTLVCGRRRARCQVDGTSSALLSSSFGSKRSGKPSTTSSSCSSSSWSSWSSTSFSISHLKRFLVVQGIIVAMSWTGSTSQNFLFADVSALAVVTAPRWKNMNDRAGYHDGYNRGKQEQQDAAVPLNLRIRTSTREDLTSVAGMLANALVVKDDHDDDTQHHRQRKWAMSFHERMEFLRVRAGVLQLLQSRWDAIHAGQKLATTPLRVIDGGRSSGHGSTSIVPFHTLPDKDQLHVLWSDEGFRRKVDKAASLSNEDHIWKTHNFACSPATIDWLYHKMITAENTVTNEVVGFCEIAMLPIPAKEDGDLDCTLENLITHKPIPTIANMITSPDYRRRGIGSRLMTTATNFVQRRHTLKRTDKAAPSSPIYDTHDVDDPSTIINEDARSSVPCSELSLFVEQDNNPAIAMYESLGFRKIRRVRKGQWYMSKSVRPKATVLQQESVSVMDDMALAYI